MKGDLWNNLKNVNYKDCLEFISENYSNHREKNMAIRAFAIKINHLYQLSLGKDGGFDKEIYSEIE